MQYVFFLKLFGSAIKLECSKLYSNSSCTCCQVALKYMDKKSVCGASLARKIDLLLRLSHLHIVEVFHVVESTAWCAVEMELAANGDLVDYVHEKRWWPS